MQERPHNSDGGLLFEQLGAHYSDLRDLLFGHLGA